LKRGSPSNYWNNFLRFLWYKNSIQTEGRHPMMCGYFRLKGRTTRRPGLPILPRWEYYTARVKETLVHLRGMLRVIVEMEELWLQTRHPSAAEQRVVEELDKIRDKYDQLKLADLQFAFLRAKEHFPGLSVPSKVHLFWAKWSPLLVQNKVYTREDLRAFWSTVRRRWSDQHWFCIPVHKVLLNLIRDVQLSILFLLHVAREL
jgi:hypothetical protein